jgi:hypothetical protein
MKNSEARTTARSRTKSPEAIPVPAPKHVCIQQESVLVTTEESVAGPSNNPMEVEDDLGVTPQGVEGDPIVIDHPLDEELGRRIGAE